MDFVISGGAGKPDNKVANDVTSEATSKFVAATGGFASIEVTEKAMTVTMIDYNGTVLYSYTRDQCRPRITLSSFSDTQNFRIISSSLTFALLVPTLAVASLIVLLIVFRLCRYRKNDGSFVELCNQQDMERCTQCTQMCSVNDVMEGRATR